MSELLGLMIAGGRIEWLPARTPWPMHQALRELDDELGRRGLRDAAGVALSFVPSPEVGLAVRGGDAALQSLIHDGVLHRTGVMLEAGLAADEHALVRRRLMTIDAAAAGAIQRAGSRWSALASTVAKKPVAAALSPGPIVTSAAV